GNGTGTITLATPAPFSQLVLADASGSGATTMNVTLNFSDGSKTTFSGLTVSDWFGGANPIIAGIDRLNRTSGAYDTNTTDPRIYSNFITLNAADSVKNLTSLTVAQTAGGVLNIFALSGGSGVSTLNFPNAFAVNTAASTIDITNITGLTVGALSLGNTLS